MAICYEIRDDLLSDVRAISSPLLTFVDTSEAYAERCILLRGIRPHQRVCVVKTHRKGKLPGRRGWSERRQDT